MTRPVDRNRLDGDQSRHLHRFATHPVNWQPWDDTAFDAAAELGRPLFVSIGYEECRWCQELAEACFQDEEVASMLNGRFVPVKVDRLLQPEIDLVYQAVYQQQADRAGWPLSVWLTPKRRPFEIGTHVSKRGTEADPGLLDVLETVLAEWTEAETRKTIETRARNWTATLKKALARPATGSVAEIPSLDHVAQTAVRAADRVDGGWGQGPKFPHPARIRLLLDAYDGNERAVYRDVATETLDAMAAGGIYDHVGGGFHRYATDRQWNAPQFEKLLGSNAALVRCYLDAYQRTGTERYADIARETLEWIDRELTAATGGFYTAFGSHSTAQSDTEPGAFYRWSSDQVFESLVDDSEGGLFATTTVDKRNAEIFCERYGIDASEPDEPTVPRETEPASAIASAHDIGLNQVQKALQNARKELRAERSEGNKPPLNESILAGWNGLTISAMAEASLVLEDRSIEPAVRALSFLEEALWDETDRRLRRSYFRGGGRGTGLLEDYASLGRGAFDCYQATGKIEFLGLALDLGRTIVRDFWDGQMKTLTFAEQGRDDLVARPLDVRDRTTPSSTAVAADLLTDLALFAPDEKFDRIATETINTHRNCLVDAPINHASMRLSSENVTTRPAARTIVDTDPIQRWTDSKGQSFQSTTLVWEPNDEAEADSHLSTLGLENPPPVWNQNV